MSVRGAILLDLQKLVMENSNPVALTYTISGIMEDMLKWAKWMHTQEWKFEDYKLEEFYEKFKADQRVRY